MLVVVGFLVFLSALLSVLAEDIDLFYRMLFKQILLGIVGGVGAAYIAYQVQPNTWRRYAMIIFALSLIITAGVFVPGLGVRHGGAVRWIDIGFVSFQPAEILKVGAVLALGSWLAYVKDQVTTVRFGLVPLLAVIGLSGIVLLMQPDT